MKGARQKIKEFEDALDAELAAKDIFSYDPSRVIVDSAGAISVAYSKYSPPDDVARSILANISRGFNVALPMLIARSGGTEPSPAGLIADLQSMSHYFLLREYLYYTYNSPGSLEWEFDDTNVHVKIIDASIPRQFAQYPNSVLLKLAHSHASFHGLADEAVGLLRDQQELGTGSHIERALALAAQEADLRIANEFDVLGGESSLVKLGGYDYSTFFKVYRFLLAKCLYHRYWARANDTWPTFMFPKQWLPYEIAENTGLDADVVSGVLADLSYSKANRGIPPMYFSMIDHQDLPDYIMVPDAFIESDGPAQLLRVQAMKSPDTFLRNVSTELGKNFTDLVAASFQNAGFLVKKNVSLRHLSPMLPDVDILVVSREATLGYYIFACEVKATLPGFWAKDFLRTLQPNSLPKAFSQVDAVLTALKSDQGIDFLIGEVLSLDKSPMPAGLIVGRGLIVTPQSTGMFFDHAPDQMKVIDYHTLSHILQNSDGDVVYILHRFTELQQVFQPRIAEVSARVGPWTVTYDGIEASPIVEFPQNLWKSAGLDIQVAEDFYREGGSPFDVLKPRSGQQPNET
jgi:hypothetical protein